MANLEAGRGSGGAPGGEYLVFLSFRGSDTHYGFTGCVYQVLGDARIRAIRDEDELRVGEVMGRELLRAIDGSILSTPIFSQSYATSKWCIRERARILPIFVDVEPADVKLKTSSYRDALSEHEKKFPEVKAWRRALAKVDEVKGWNLQKDEGQEQLIKLVVEEVLDKFKMNHKPMTEHLVGLTGQVEEVMKLLDTDSGDMWLIGIHGMSGIGKITAAKVVFNQLCSHFKKRCSFLEDIRKKLMKEGLVKLQNILLFGHSQFSSNTKHS